MALTRRLLDSTAVGLALRALAVVALCAVAGGVVAAGAAVAGERAGLGALVLAAVVVVGALLLRLPARWWPSAILAVSALLPAGSLPGLQGLNGSLSPALVMIPVWLLLELREGRLWSGVSHRHPVALVACLLYAAVLAASSVSGGGLVTSAAWTVNLVVVTLAVALGLRRDSFDRVVSTWSMLGGVLGVYAVGEAFVLGSNPVWGWAATIEDSNRAAASFGHPLWAGSFFAGALVLSAGRLLLGQRLITRSTAVAVVALAGSAGGLAAAGSRGALLAAGAGVVIIGFGLVRAVLRSEPAAGRRVLVAVLVGAAFASVVTVGLAQREEAGSAEGSNIVRERSLATGLYLAERTGPLGEGAGRAYAVKTSTPGPGTDEGAAIENAWLELYVATGPIGCAAALLVGGVFVVAGVRSRAWPGLALTTACVVAFTFYNALEGNKPLTMLLLGLALGGCLSGRSDQTETPTRPSLSASRTSAAPSPVLAGR